MPPLRKSVVHFLVLVWGLTAMGCESEYPEGIAAATIRGQLVYGGDAHKNLATPAIGVYAFSSWPPSGPPHHNAVFDQLDGLAEGIRFEMKRVQPFSYVLVGQLVDLQDPTGSPIAAGGYPDFCSLPMARVQVVGDEVIDNIRIEVFDSAGQEDPCTKPGGDVLPEPGKASVVVQVIGPGAGVILQPQDKLSLALFTTWPPSTPPMSFSQVAGDEVSFPHRLVDNRIAPGDWVVTVCLDVNGDNLMCDGEEDVYVAVLDGQSISFQEGQVVSAQLNLETSESKVLDEP